MSFIVKNKIHSCYIIFKHQLKKNRFPNVTHQEKTTKTVIANPLNIDQNFSGLFMLQYKCLRYKICSKVQSYIKIVDQPLLELS